MKKSILITGAGAGIGRELAILAARQGFCLGLWSLRAQELCEVKLACENLGAGEVHCWEVDVSDRKRCQAAGLEFLQKLGTPQMVIANAGLGGLNPAQVFDLEMNEKLMQVNFFGTANSFVPFVAEMKKLGSGHLVAVSSLAAFRGMPQAASYSASKMAQARLCESFRVDLRKFGIKVSCAHPGFVKTAMANHKDFDMPFMITAEKCAQVIWDRSWKGCSQILFPWPMKMLVMLNRLMPNWLFDRLLPILSPPMPGQQPRIFG